MKSYFKSIYSDIKRVHLNALAGVIPDNYHSCFLHLGGGIDQIYILKQLLPTDKKLKILVVGVYGGRDFWGLKASGHDVSGMDLDVIEDCWPTIAGDAEGLWPFPDKNFDVVLIGEVLEHLLFDASALLEARRALKDEGSLIVTVPFWSHNDPTHIRTYSPQSIQRLLSCCGFSTIEYLERPGIIFLKAFNYLLFPFAYIYYQITKKSLYSLFLDKVCLLEYSFAKVRWPRLILGIFGVVNWGCTILAIKSKSYNYKDINRSTFIPETLI